MSDLNNMIFQSMNASANPPTTILAAAKFSAEWLIFIVAIGLVLAWLRGGKVMRLHLLDAGLITTLALLINKVISSAWYHPRPFALDIGHQFIPHAADASFPSDHGTVLFAVAFAMMVSKIGKLWQILVLIFALLTAWARIYLGVHWPFDMAGSILIAAGVSLALRPMLASGNGMRLKNALLRIFDRILKIVHIPASIIPPSFPPVG